jgi:hypothetical protein
MNPGNLPKGKFFMKILISKGEKRLEGRVRWRGLSKNELISHVAGSSVMVLLKNGCPKRFI